MELLRELVAAPSVSGEEAAVAALVEERARGWGLPVVRDAAGVSVRTYAMSQQAGGMGDLVMVQSLASKERYAARVIGVRELEIFTAGASAAELAANPAPAQ